MDTGLTEAYAYDAIEEAQHAAPYARANAAALSI
jgi:hypothetical protein